MVHRLVDPCSIRSSGSSNTRWLVLILSNRVQQNIAVASLSACTHTEINSITSININIHTFPSVHSAYRQKYTVRLTRMSNTNSSYIRETTPARCAQKKRRKKKQLQGGVVFRVAGKYRLWGGGGGGVKRTYNSSTLCTTQAVFLLRSTSDRWARFAAGFGVESVNRVQSHIDYSKPLTWSFFILFFFFIFTLISINYHHSLLYPHKIFTPKRNKHYLFILIKKSLYVNHHVSDIVYLFICLLRN